MRRKTLGIYLISTLTISLVLGCSAQREAETGEPATSSPTTPAMLPGAVPTDPRAQATGGPFPLTIASVLPTIPPPSTPIPPPACGTTSSQDASTSSRIILLDNQHWGKAVDVFAGDELLLRFTPANFQRTWVFTDGTLLCQAEAMNTNPPSQAVYRVLRPGFTQLVIETGSRGVGSVVTLSIRAHPAMNASVSSPPASPDGLYPPAGAAADYAWLAGQVWTYPENPPCSTLDMYGGRKSYESNVALTGMVWDAAHKQGSLPDGSFVVVFGYIQQWQSVREPAPGNGMCSNPFAYVVERVLVNRRPALDGSQGPAPAANSPLVIPTDDSSTPVEIHIGDRVKVVPHGHYLNWLPFPMQVEHPEILIREADSWESRGSQGIYRAIAPGTTRIGGIIEPCPGCKSNLISFGVDLVIR